MFKKPNIRKSKGYDQLAVYVNPWSTATTNPKIPDGKCRLSTGLRLQAVREFQNNENGDMEFIIFPGCASGLAVNNTTVGNNVLANMDHVVFENHGMFDSSYTGIAPNDTNHLAQQSSNVLAKWRLVSQAVKFTLVNNADENDGWFEAIRFTATNDFGKFGIKPHTNTDQAFVGVRGKNLDGDGDANMPPEDVYHDNIWSNIGNLVEHPSYISGKLRDIHRYQFQLRAIDTDHDFNNVSRSYAIHGAAIDGPSENPESLNEVSHEANDMKKAMIDDSYDLIFLRVHGRPAATGVTPTRLMTHVVSNQEIMYEQGCAFSRYHSETDASPMWPALNIKMVEGNIKAAWKTRAN